MRSATYVSTFGVLLCRAGAALQLQRRCSRGLPRSEEGIPMQFNQEGAPATLGKGSMAGKEPDEEQDEEEDEDDYEEEEEHEQEGG